MPRAAMYRNGILCVRKRPSSYKTKAPAANAKLHFPKLSRKVAIQRFRPNASAFLFAAIATTLVVARGEREW